MTEEWRNFPVIGGRSFSKYEVSSLGQRRNKISGWVFSVKPNSAGYVCNTFVSDEGNSKEISAHSVVARAFLGEPDSDDLTVDHINRERADNRLINLRWATQKQQTVNSDRSKCIVIGQPIIQYTMDMEEIKRWPTIITAAKELKISQSNISQACRGSYKQAGGYKWVYERQDLDGEIWRDYESMGIQVSNMGRIKSSCRHIIYGSKTADGYLKYGYPGKLVHIIIAKVFLPNPDEKPQVNHKDKNRANNKLENLEWATRSEQMIHSHKNSNPDRYSTSRAVKQYIGSRTGSNVEGKFIGKYKSISEASRQTGCTVSAICGVCSGLSESTKGYVFKYSNKDVLNRQPANCPKKVDLIDEKGNIVETYDSVKAIALDLEISDKSIYKILGGTRKKTRDGYIFKYH